MFITWDHATKEGDYSCKIYWRKGKYGNVYIEKVEYFKKKEVKKVNKIPYFELKVVKVKNNKEKPDCDDCSNYDTFCKNYCSYYKKHIKQPKGNWVNGENLDKIKFPCLCSYYVGGNRYNGIINKNWDIGEYHEKYELSSLIQTKSKNDVGHRQYLEQLIKAYRIHILKGKIIIFEEEEK